MNRKGEKTEPYSSNTIRNITNFSFTQKGKIITHLGPNWTVWTTKHSVGTPLAARPFSGNGWPIGWPFVEGCLATETD